MITKYKLYVEAKYIINYDDTINITPYIENNIFHGVEATHINHLIGSLGVAIMKDKPSDGKSKIDNEYIKLVYGNYFIHSVMIEDNLSYRHKGIATLMYKETFNYLKNIGVKIIYSGHTRNSNHVNDIWNKFKDGEITLSNGDIIYYKKLTNYDNKI